MPIPPEFKGLKKGDWLTVQKGYMRRSGQGGLVTDIHDDGVGLDFFTCGICGAKSCSCYTSMEFWGWEELEPLHELES